MLDAIGPARLRFPFGNATKMTLAQRRLTISFGCLVGLAMAWGLGEYAFYWYQDYTAPPHVLSERAFLVGLPVLIEASIISFVLTVVFGIWYFCLRETWRHE